MACLSQPDYQNHAAAAAATGGEPLTCRAATFETDMPQKIVESEESLFVFWTNTNELRWRSSLGGFSAEKSAARFVAKRIVADSSAFSLSLSPVAKGKEWMVGRYADCDALTEALRSPD